MSRICVIGDSHIGSLLAAGIVERLEGEHTLTFFAAHLDHFRHLKRQGRRLVPLDEVLEARFREHTGGLLFIDVDAFDEFLIVGLHVWLGLLVNTYHDYLPDRLAGPPGIDLADRYLLSDGAFRVICRDILIGTEAGRIAAEIRTLTDRPVTIVPVPNPGLGLDPAAYPAGYPPFHAVAEAGLGHFYAEAFEVASADMAERLGVRVSPLPPQAAHDAMFNRFEYSLLAETDEAASSEEKLNAVVHAGSAYGELLIADLFGR